MALTKHYRLGSVFGPETIELLRQYARYVNEIDGGEGELAELAESLVLGMLDQHDRFQEWVNDRKGVAAVCGWRSWARAGSVRPTHLATTHG